MVKYEINKTYEITADHDLEKTTLGHIIEMLMFYDPYYVYIDDLKTYQKVKFNNFNIVQNIKQLFGVKSFRVVKDVKNNDKSFS